MSIADRQDTLTTAGLLSTGGGRNPTDLSSEFSRIINTNLCTVISEKQMGGHQHHTPPKGRGGFEL